MVADVGEEDHEAGAEDFFIVDGAVVPCDAELVVLIDGDVEFHDGVVQDLYEHHDHDVLQEDVEKGEAVAQELKFFGVFAKRDSSGFDPFQAADALFLLLQVGYSWFGGFSVHFCKQPVGVESIHVQVLLQILVLLVVVFAGGNLPCILFNALCRLVSCYFLL